MNWPDKIQRTVLPVPGRPRTGLATYAKDPALTQRHKEQVASHWGGTSNGTIVHWPNGINGFSYLGSPGSVTRGHIYGLVSRDWRPLHCDHGHAAGSRLRKYDHE